MSGFQFHTEVNIPNYPWRTGYKKTNIFMGSCFTENVGNKMARLKYEVDINPFGILYNPVSVANGINILMNNQIFQKEDLVQHDNLWHSFYHHGRFSSPDSEEALQKMNDRIKSASRNLEQAGFLFITFGTAWVYNYRKTGLTVSNCHKIPAKEFSRQRLTVDEIVEVFVPKLNRLWEMNPGLNVIFTVSPIRHWKDGAVENQRSKATLILAVDQIIRNANENRCSYFPSYEIVMDELRDYRFYSTDMIHLTDTAVDYIWEKFQNNLIEPESIKLSQQVQKIIKAVNHKPFNKFTIENLRFLNQTFKQTEQLMQKHHFLDLENEKNFLYKQIKEIEKNKKIN